MKTSFPFALVYGLSLVLLALSSEVPAQTQLPAVTVKGSEEPTGTLTVPDTAQAIENLRRIPGGVEVVPDTAFQEGPAQNVKDILDWVPGVFIQSRYGDDARISIRGSGLSRPYGNRGINMFLDGVPLNTSDGLVDNFEIDPTAYRYVEVFKGANALRYGANSLGGAINFVTPTGHDASPLEARVDLGSFGYRRAQASTGAVKGAMDYFVTASAQRSDGYRDHSDGHQTRLSGNMGYRFSADVETRFYLNAASIRQRLPGEVTKDSALESPRTANPEFERLDQRRDIDSVRLANKTTLRMGSATVDLGLFGSYRHVMHPIYQWLDYRVRDYGGYVRLTDERDLAGRRNRLVLGANLHNGSIDNQQYINKTGGHKGDLASSNVDRSKNMSAYMENSLALWPHLTLIAGVQFQHIVRERQDRFLSDGDQSGRRSYNNASPRIGLLWDVDPGWQIFANVSRSAEVPTFDANSFATAASSDVDAQTATTYEIGTRGTRGDVSWDVSLYRANLRNELQCLTTAPWSPCTIINAGRTVHQGVEAGMSLAVMRNWIQTGDRLELDLAYTYNDFFFDNDPLYGSNRLPGVPPHYLRAGLVYRLNNGVFAGPNVEWVPRGYYADNANQVKVDPYALLNFRIGYQPAGSGFSFYLEGRNLTDKRYVATVAVAGSATAASELFNPGTGRAVYGGMQYRW